MKNLVKIVVLVGLYSTSAFADICNLSKAVVKIVEYNAFANCKNLKIEEVAKMTYITIRGSDVVGLELKADDFKVFEKVETLGIATWLGETLPSEILSSIPNIRTLEVDAPALIVWDKKFIEEAGKLPKLKSFTISSIKLTELPDQAFSPLTQIDSLSVSVTALVTVKSQALTGLEKLTSLEFYSNEDLTSFESGAFDSLVNLTTLRITNNNIEYLEGGLFKNLSQLARLDLTSNKLFSVDYFTLEGLTSLKNLDISSNQISHIRFWTLYATPNLEVFEAGSNKLEIIEGGIFWGTPKLISANFGYNSALKFFDVTAVQELQDLETLELWGTKLDPENKLELREILNQKVKF